MASAISPLSYLDTPKARTSSSGTNASNSAQSSSGNSGSQTTGGISANEETFLTLLVSQLKNQDPLQPTDGTQFVTQLAQFSSLEQLININKGVGAIATNTAPITSSSGTSDSGSSNS